MSSPSPGSSAPGRRRSSAARAVRSALAAPLPVRPSRSDTATTDASPCRTWTCTGSPVSRTRSGAISSRTSTTPWPSSSGRRREGAPFRRHASASACNIVGRSGGRSRSSVLILAFDTATAIATSALVRDGTVLGERTTTPVRVLEAFDELLREHGVEPSDLDALAVGVGPGSFTGVRMGLAVARGLGLGLGLAAAGVSTLEALGAGAPGAVPVIDAKSGEVFVEHDGRVVALAATTFEAPGRTCVGDGAIRYRERLEQT